MDYLDNNRLIAHYCGFNIMEPLPSPPRGKRERYQAMAQRALAIVKELKTSLQ